MSSVILGVTTGVSVSSLVSVDPVFLRFRGAGIRGALIIFAFLQGVESIFSQCQVYVSVLYHVLNHVLNHVKVNNFD